MNWRLVARIFVICGHGDTRDNGHHTDFAVLVLSVLHMYRSLYSSIAIGA
jgi:hypothetical protein